MDRRKERTSQDPRPANKDSEPKRCFTPIPERGCLPETLHLGGACPVPTPAPQLPHPKGPFVSTPPLPPPPPQREPPMGCAPTHPGHCEGPAVACPPSRPKQLLSGTKAIRFFQLRPRDRLPRPQTRVRGNPGEVPRTPGISIVGKLLARGGTGEIHAHAHTPIGYRSWLVSPPRAGPCGISFIQLGGPSGHGW